MSKKDLVSNKRKQTSPSARDTSEEDSPDQRKMRDYSSSSFSSRSSGRERSPTSTDRSSEAPQTAGKSSLKRRNADDYKDSANDQNQRSNNKNNVKFA